MAKSLEDLGIQRLMFSEFEKRILDLIPNRDTPIIQAKMRAVEGHKQVGANGTPVKCVKSNCNLRASYLLKFQNQSAPDPMCSKHIQSLVEQLESKSWVYFQNEPLVLEYFTILSDDIWPGVVRARIKQLKNLTP